MEEIDSAVLRHPATPCAPPGTTETVRPLPSVPSPSRHESWNHSFDDSPLPPPGTAVSAPLSVRIPPVQSRVSTLPTRAQPPTSVLPGDGGGEPPHTYTAHTLRWSPPVDSAPTAASVPTSPALAVNKPASQPQGRVSASAGARVPAGHIPPPPQPRHTYHETRAHAQQPPPAAPASPSNPIHTWGEPRGITTHGPALSSTRPPSRGSASSGVGSTRTLAAAAAPPQRGTRGGSNAWRPATTISGTLSDAAIRRRAYEDDAETGSSNVGAADIAMEMTSTFIGGAPAAVAVPHGRTRGRSSSPGWRRAGEARGPAPLSPLLQAPDARGLQHRTHPQPQPQPRGKKLRKTVKVKRGYTPAGRVGAHLSPQQQPSDDLLHPAAFDAHDALGSPRAGPWNPPPAAGGAGWAPNTHTPQQGIELDCGAVFYPLEGARGAPMLPAAKASPHGVHPPTHGMLRRGTYDLDGTRVHSLSPGRGCLGSNNPRSIRGFGPVPCRAARRGREGLRAARAVSPRTPRYTPPTGASSPLPPRGQAVPPPPVPSHTPRPRPQDHAGGGGYSTDEFRSPSLSPHLHDDPNRGCKGGPAPPPAPAAAHPPAPHPDDHHFFSACLRELSPPRPRPRPTPGGRGVRVRAPSTSSSSPREVMGSGVGSGDKRVGEKPGGSGTPGSGWAASKHGASRVRGGGGRGDIDGDANDSRSAVGEPADATTTTKKKKTTAYDSSAFPRRRHSTSPRRAEAGPRSGGGDAADDAASSSSPRVISLADLKKKWTLPKVDVKSVSRANDQPVPAGPPRPEQPPPPQYAPAEEQRHPPPSTLPCTTPTRLHGTAAPTPTTPAPRPAPSAPAPQEVRSPPPPPATPLPADARQAATASGHGTPHPPPAAAPMAAAPPAALSDHNSGEYLTAHSAADVVPVAAAQRGAAAATEGVGPHAAQSQPQPPLPVTRMSSQALGIQKVSSRVFPEAEAARASAEQGAAQQNGDNDARQQQHRHQHPHNAFDESMQPPTPGASRASGLGGGHHRAAGVPTAMPHSAYSNGHGHDHDHSNQPREKEPDDPAASPATWATAPSDPGRPSGAGGGSYAAHSSGAPPPHERHPSREAPPSATAGGASHSCPSSGAAGAEECQTPNATMRGVATPPASQAPAPALVVSAGVGTAPAGSPMSAGYPLVPGSMPPQSRAATGGDECWTPNASRRSGVSVQSRAHTQGDSRPLPPPGSPTSPVGYPPFPPSMQQAAPTSTGDVAAAHPTASGAADIPNDSYTYHRPPSSTATDHTPPAIAHTLYKAMKGFGTDEDAIYRSAARVQDPDEWAAVCQTFAAAYPDFHGGDVVAALRDELTRGERDRVAAALRGAGVDVFAAPSASASVSAPLSGHQRRVSAPAVEDRASASAPPSRPVLVASPTARSYRDRVLAMLERYAPDNAGNADALLEKYAGQEEALVASLVRRFGPEPETSQRGEHSHPTDAVPPVGSSGAGTPVASIDSHAPRSYRDRVVAILQHYSPEQVGSADALLEKYAGQEEALLASLVRRFGPEPQQSVVAGGSSSAGSRGHVSAPSAPASTSSLSATQAHALAEKLYQAMKGFGTDEAAVYDCVGRVRGPTDFAAVTAAFRNAYPTFHAGDVVAALEDELTDDELEKVAGILERVGVDPVRDAAGPVACATPSAPSVPQSNAPLSLDDSVPPAPPSHPSSHHSAPVSHRSHRDRVIAILQHYSPEQVGSADALLEKYSGQGEALIASLVRRFGPEPGPTPAPQADLSNTQGSAATADRAAASVPLSYRDRVVTILQHYSPDNAGNADTLLEKYAGQEEALIASLVRRFGPEPEQLAHSREPAEWMTSEGTPVLSAATTAPVPTHHDRVVAILQHYSPDQMGSANALLEKYAGQEEALIASLVQRLGPEPGTPLPPPSRPSSAATGPGMGGSGSYRDRVVAILQHYSPEQAGNADALLEKYAGQEEALIASLVRRFGPEPPGTPIAAAGAVGSGSTAQMSYRARVIAMLQHYSPEQVGSADALLEKYAGQEEALLASLVRRFGPEPEYVASQMSRRPTLPLEDSDATDVAAAEGAVAEASSIDGYEEVSRPKRDFGDAPTFALSPQAARAASLSDIGVFAVASPPPPPATCPGGGCDQPRPAEAAFHTPAVKRHHPLSFASLEALQHIQTPSLSRFSKRKAPGSSKSGKGLVPWTPPAKTRRAPSQPQPQGVDGTESDDGGYDLSYATLSPTAMRHTQRRAAGATNGRGDPTARRKHPVSSWKRSWKQGRGGAGPTSSPSEGLDHHHAAHDDSATAADWLSGPAAAARGIDFDTSLLTPLVVDRCGGGGGARGAGAANPDVLHHTCMAVDVDVGGRMSARNRWGDGCFDRSPAYHPACVSDAVVSFSSGAVSRGGGTLPPTPRDGFAAAVGVDGVSSDVLLPVAFLDGARPTAAGADGHGGRAPSAPPCPPEILDPAACVVLPSAPQWSVAAVESAAAGCKASA